MVPQVLNRALPVPFMFLPLKNLGTLYSQEKLDLLDLGDNGKLPIARFILPFEGFVLSFLSLLIPPEM
jgi:hypothetical protein